MLNYVFYKRMDTLEVNESHKISQRNSNDSLSFEKNTRNPENLNEEKVFREKNENKNENQDNISNQEGSADSNRKNGKWSYEEVIILI